jgi:hypothetical protein
MPKYLFNVETSVEITAPDEETAYAILNGEPVQSDWWKPPTGDFEIDSDVLGYMRRRTYDSDTLLVEVIS